MLKLITLNIETDKHYNRWLPFLAEEKADIICLQEVPKSVLSRIQALGFRTSFAPMFRKNLDTAADDEIGVALASKLPYSIHEVYYGGSQADLNFSTGTGTDLGSAFVYLMAEVQTDGKIYRVGTTHMHNTKNGAADEIQNQLMDRMLSALKQEKSHCICGDFNMPRGFNELYDLVTKDYTDAIPQHYKSSLDRDLHRAGKMQIDQPIFDCFMVDYVFTQRPYLAKIEKLQFSVSDHAAVVGYLDISD